MKPKITGISNNDDSVWFLIEPSMTSIDILYNLFDELDNRIDPHYFNEFANGYSDYNGISRHIDGDNYMIYILFLDEINLILRKTKNWEKKRDEIMDKFEFSKSE